MVAVAKKPSQEGTNHGTDQDAPYVQEAKRMLASNALKNAAAKDEREAKKDCIKAMYDAHIASFEFQLGNVQYTGVLSRDEGERINVRKLYTLVVNSEISLDEFFECITATQTAVTDTLGPAYMARITEPYQKGLDLHLRAGQPPEV